MAITRGATFSSGVRTVTGTDASVSHTVDSGTTLLVVSTMYEAGETVSGTPQWSEGGGENLTLVDETTRSGSNVDMCVSTFALVNPTAGTGTVTVTHSSNDNSITTATNYIGTETSATMSENIAFLEEDVNNSTTNVTVFASGGTSGNTLYAVGGFRGDDGQGITVPTNFTELFDGASGTSSSADIAGYVCDYIGGAPSACTWTWSSTDENAGHYLEIFPGDENTVLPLLGELDLLGYAPSRAFGLLLTGYAPTATVEEGGEALTELPLLGTLALSGKLPTVVTNHIAAPTVGSLALGVAGNDPTGVVGEVEQPLLGTLALGVAGSAPEAVIANVREPSTDALVLGVVGSDPTASVGELREPGIDELVLGVTTPTVIHDRVASTLLGTLTIDEQTPDPIQGQIEQPLLGTLALGVAGFAPTVSVGDLREPAIDELVLAGKVPTIVVANVVTPAIDELAFTGYEPTTGAALTEDPLVGSLALAGIIPTAVVANVVEPATVGLVIDEQLADRSVTSAGTVDPLLGSLSLSGIIPTTAVDNVVTPGVGSLSLGVVGSDPTVNVGEIELPTVGALALGVSGSEPTVVVNHVAAPPIDELAFTGYAPTIPGVGTIEVPTGSINIWKYVGLKLQGIPPTLSIADVVDPTTGAVQIERVLYSGTHNGGAGDPVLYTFPLELPIDDLIGYVVRNLTDGSEAVITDNDNNQVFGQLTGGTDNDWDPGDLFEITTGTPPSLNVTVFPTVGALTLSGAVPTLLGTVSVPTGALTFRGYATIDQDTVEPAVGALTLSGAAPTLKGIEQPTTGSLTCTGYAPTVDYAQSPDLSIGSLALAGIAPAAVVSQPALPTTGALAFASDPPEVADTGAIITLKGSLALTGQAPSVQVKSWADPGSDSLIISGIPPTVEVLTTPSYTIEPGTASLVLTSTVQAEEPTLGSLTLEGQPVSIFYRDGTFIENPNATTAVPSNYEQCDYSGFRVMPGSLKMTWNKHAVRKKSYESRHPQDTLRSIPEKRKGSRRPEREDTFIDTLYPDGVDSEDL